MLLGDNRNGEGVRDGVGNPKLAMTQRGRMFVMTKGGAGGEANT